MATRSSPTVKRRRIARELRRLRTEKDLQPADVAQEVGISKRTLARIEAAEVSARPSDVASMLRMYGVSDEDILPLVELAKQARKRGWWQSYNNVLPDWFEVYVGLESDATRIATHECELMPGLLQTADYARAVIRVEHPNATDAEVDRRVELRMERQAREDPLALWVILSEAALRRVVGSPKIMRAQLDRLLVAAKESSTDIQVLPYSVGEYGSMGSAFSILSFPDPRDPSVVYLETRAGSLYLEEADEAAQYETLFDHLRATAASARRSRDMIIEARDAL